MNSLYDCISLSLVTMNWNQSQLRLILIRNNKTKDRVSLHALHVVRPACCRAVYPHYGM